MEKLTLSETYMVLFYYAAGKHTDLCQPQNSVVIQRYKRQIKNPLFSSCKMGIIK